MSKMTIYKVTLEPLDWFFFGGESTFDNSVKQSYIAHSNMFPQQTALLGMLRYQLLKQEGLLSGKGRTPDMDKVNALIGPESFTIDNNSQSFGHIKGLSPVFIEKEFTRVIKQGKNLESKREFQSYHPVPLTDGYKISFDRNVRVFIHGQEKHSLINDNDSFDEKQYRNFMVFHEKNGCNLNAWEIFETRMQIGITKNTDVLEGEDDEKGRFFKHEMVRFRNDKENKVVFRFAFYAMLDNELQGDFVYLGAERSCFKMKADVVVKDVPDSPISSKQLHELFKNNHPSEEVPGRIELLSATFVEDMDKLNSLCDFHWSFLTPFRNIVQTKDGRGKLKAGDVCYHRKEVCSNMLCAGSMLFFENEEKRAEIEKLLSNTHLQDIGYNYYI